MSLLSALSVPPRPLAGTTVAPKAVHGGAAFDAALVVAHEDLSNSTLSANEELTTEAELAPKGQSEQNRIDIGFDAPESASRPSAFAGALPPFVRYDERALAFVQPLQLAAVTEPAATAAAATAATTAAAAAAAEPSTIVEPAPESAPVPSSNPSTSVEPEPEAALSFGTAPEALLSTPPVTAVGSAPQASPEPGTAPVPPLPTPSHSAPAANQEKQGNVAVPSASSSPKLEATLRGHSELAATTVMPEAEAAQRPASAPSNNTSAAAATAAPALTPAAVNLSSTPAPAAPTPAHAAQPPLAAQLARPLFSLATAGDGEHTLTISVSPERLGPVTVHATVTGDRLHIELFSSSEHGRDAVRSVLGELRRDLAGTGLHASLGLSADDAPPKQSNPHSGLGQSASQQDRASDEPDGALGNGGDGSASEPGTDESTRRGLTEQTPDAEFSHGSGSPSLPTLDLIT